MKSLERFLDRLDRIAARRRREPSHLVRATRRARGDFSSAAAGVRGDGAGMAHAKAHGDLDLVAWDNDVLCFVEVKTRTTRAVAPAEAAVDTDKKRMLRKMAHHYLRQLPTRIFRCASIFCPSISRLEARLNSRSFAARLAGSEARKVLSSEFAFP